MDGVIVVAALWGFAEATLFFIVPDVWLTMVAVVSRPRAIPALVATVVGALAGGIVMREWGRRNPMSARLAIALVPGIHAPMIERVERDVHAKGLRAMLTGPLRGVPYKIYAVAAGRLRAWQAAFLVTSLVARTPRFVLLTTVALGLRAWPLNPLSSAGAAAVVGSTWFVFYCRYFRAMSAGVSSC